VNQTIVFDYPPMFDEIDAVFHVKGKPVIYAWGDKIFNPQRIVIGAELLAHEEVHGVRQLKMLGGVTDWWKRYLDSPKFRLDEEVQAHWAEYHVLATMGNRHQRKAALKQTAVRLASPLYGRMIGPNRARELLLEVEREYKRLARNNNPMFFDEESTDVDQ
jgi:hypothetical protein